MNPSRKNSEQPTQFFDAELSEWAWVKHQMFSRYLRVFAYKLQSRFSSILIVDGFAGGGRYEDGSPGSPVLAAQLNDDLGIGRCEVHVVAVERNAECLRSLRDALAPWMRGPSQRAWVLEGTFRDHVEDLVRRSANVPTFVFLDPFGMESVSVDQLRPLLISRRSAPLELLIRVDPTLLARFAGQVRAGRTNPKRARTAAAFAVLLEKLGIDPQWASDLLDRIDAPTYRRLRLLEEYQAAFEQRFTYTHYLPVRPSSRAAPKYHLLHVTDSSHGYVKMNDVVCKLFESQVRNEEEERRAALGQGDLFPVEVEPLVTTQQVDTVLLAAARNLRGRSVEFIELRAALVRHFGTKLRERDHNASLKRLEQAGLLIVDATRGKNKDRALISAA